jgi:UDP-N-acetylglucosamine 4,6-dehydratase/5-epimerase
MAQAIAPDCQIDCVGIRPGEKLHEVLLSEDEARNAIECDDMFVIQPAHSWWRKENWKSDALLPEGFRYSSDTNSQWLTAEDLYTLVEGSAPPAAWDGETTVRASA